MNFDRSCNYFICVALLDMISANVLTCMYDARHNWCDDKFEDKVMTLSTGDGRVI